MDTHTHPVGGPLAKEEETKGTKIEEALVGLNKAVFDFECLTGRITGENSEARECPRSTPKAIGSLLTELPDDLNNLSNRLMDVKTSISTSLY